MRQQSAKQAARERLLRERKHARIEKAISKDGFAYCDECGLSFGPESAFDCLEGHHIIQRSLGGTDDDTNIVLLCSRCHRRIHGQ